MCLCVRCSFSSFLLLYFVLLSSCVCPAPSLVFSQRAPIAGPIHTLSFLILGSVSPPLSLLPCSRFFFFFFFLMLCCSHIPCLSLFPAAAGGGGAAAAQSLNYRQDSRQCQPFFFICFSNTIFFPICLASLFSLLSIPVFISLIPAFSVTFGKHADTHAHTFVFPFPLPTLIFLLKKKGK